MVRGSTILASERSVQRRIERFRTGGTKRYRLEASLKMFLYSPYFVVIKVMPSQKRYLWVPRRLSVTSPNFVLLRLASVPCAVLKYESTRQDFNDSRSAR